MASTTTVIRITDAKPTIKMYRTNLPAKFARLGTGNLSKYLRAVATGLRKGTVTVQPDGTVGVKAKGTVTIVTAVATNALTINGVAFTAIANGGSPTGNQWCVGAGGTADTDSATALAAKINASTTALVKNVVTATSAAGVVTLRAFTPGLLGNCITVAATGAPLTLGADCSGGRLTTGTGDDAAEITYSLV